MFCSIKQYFIFYFKLFKNLNKTFFNKFYCKNELKITLHILGLQQLKFILLKFCKV